MFDVNAGCGNWPFRPTVPNTASGLEALLRAEGITRACAYPLEAYLWPDPQEANALRLPELARSPFFVPSAVLNPTLAGCLKDYAVCRREWRVPMVRLIPNYHLYALDDAVVDALATRAGADGVALGVHLRTEDERNQNPIAKVPASPFRDVVALARRHPPLRVVAFGVIWPDIASLLDEERQSAPDAALPHNLWVELSFFEAGSSLARALELVSEERLLFGTHAPIFYPRSNVLKLQMTEAPESARAAVAAGNAQQLLGVRA